MLRDCQLSVKNWHKATKITWCWKLMGQCLVHTHKCSIPCCLHPPPTLCALLAAARRAALIVPAQIQGSDCRAVTKTSGSSRGFQVTCTLPTRPSCWDAPVNHCSGMFRGVLDLRRLTCRLWLRSTTWLWWGKHLGCTCTCMYSWFYARTLHAERHGCYWWLTPPTYTHPASVVFP